MAASAWSSGDESVGMSEGVVEEGLGVDEGWVVIFDVISASWLSREVVVRASGRERVRLTVRWKARRSCLRWAVRYDEGVLRMDLAWDRSDCKSFLGFLSRVVGSGGGPDLGV